MTSSSRSVTKSGPWISSAPSMHSVDCILAELNSDRVDKKNSVPFPEFGVDIILHHRESKIVKPSLRKFPLGLIPLFFISLQTQIFQLKHPQVPQKMTKKMVGLPPKFTVFENHLKCLI